MKHLNKYIQFINENINLLQDSSKTVALGNWIGKKCGDCGKSNPEDYWFSHWFKYIPKSKQKKFICIKCLEKRVGRELKKSDFEPYTHYYKGQEWFDKLD